MESLITILSVDDLQLVDALMKRNSATLGFLPFEALTDHQQKGGLIGAKTSNDQLAGYLLFSIHQDYFRIVHLCVDEDYRGKNLARKLVNHLRTTATTQRLIKLRCRRDFPAHDLWPTLGFVPLDEKPGRSAAGHDLTLWHLTLAPDSQLELFQAMTVDENLNAVVDAQIFFDFYEPPSTKAIPSISLLSDFLVDTLNLWVTDELLVEIDRKKDKRQRDQSRKRARAFHTISYDPKAVELFESSLRKILPTNSRSKVSDIRHLAKTAASETNVFVTRDRDLLKKAKVIGDLIDIRVLSPTELIVGLSQYSETFSAMLGRISGKEILWRPFRTSDLSRLSEFSLVEAGERHGPLIEKLNSFLVRPDIFECMLLEIGNTVVALRVLSKGGSGDIGCPIIRISRELDRPTIERFVVSDTITRAIAEKKQCIHIEREGVKSSLVSALLDMGFVASADSYVRFALPYPLNRRETLHKISAVAEEFKQALESVENVDLERHCSPLIIPNTRRNYLIPILPEYAMGLFDRDRAKQDLFGASRGSFLRWENVYYRRATYVRMIQAPGRIFWYASNPRKAVLAVSHLDSVELGSPKELFRAFNKFGILDWNAIYKMCRGNVSAKLMALRFSHTFCFQASVSLNELRTMFQDQAHSLVLQSPSKLPDVVSGRILRIGFGDKV